MGVREGETNAFVLAKDERGDMRMRFDSIMKLHQKSKVKKSGSQSIQLNISTHISIIQAYTQETNDHNTPLIAMCGGKGNK